MSVATGAPPNLTTLFQGYRQSMTTLLQRLGAQHPRYSEALIYQQRLLENLSRTVYGDTDDNQAERSQLLSQVEAFCQDVLGVAFHSLHAPEVAPEVASPDDFVNREVELRPLENERLRAARSPYTLVCAPAGYGKTYLLQRLMALTAAQQWDCRYVAASPPASLDAAAIVQAITRHPAPPTADAIPAVCNTVLQSLTAASGSDPALLLIFDCIEQLDAPTAQWVYTLLNTLYQRTRLNNREVYLVRVILAGRDVDAFWEGYRRASPRLPAPQRIPLAPFDERALQDMVWVQARKLRLQDALDDATVTQIGEELLYLSGGHPDVAHALVADLAQQFFGLGVVSDYFPQNRERWARDCLAPAADARLQGLSPELAQAARILSVFRRVNANTVQVLVEAQWLPVACKAIDLLGDMVKARLLTSPNLREPFFRDPLTRRVLAGAMTGRSAESRAQYVQLNRLARGLYAKWIRQGLQDPHLGPSQRLLSVVEWLYHALVSGDLAPAQLQTELQAHVTFLCVAPESGYVRDLIKQEIQQDAEIGYLLRRLLGADGVAIVCDWLQT